MSRFNDRTMALMMADYVNGNYDKEAFCTAMLDEHRTLQQNFTGLCVKWLETLAKYDRCDLRNEASVELAKLFVERINEYERYLPFL